MYLEKICLKRQTNNHILENNKLVLAVCFRQGEFGKVVCEVSPLVSYAGEVRFHHAHSITRVNSP